MACKLQLFVIALTCFVLLVAPVAATEEGTVSNTSVDNTTTAPTDSTVTNKDDNWENKKSKISAVDDNALIANTSVNNNPSLTAAKNIAKVDGVVWAIGTFVSYPIRISIYNSVVTASFAAQKFWANSVINKKAAPIPLS